MVLRFTADVTCMDINNNQGNLLAAGSADMTVKIVNTGTYEVVATFEGHLAPILSVSLDYHGRYAASSSCDGSIRYVTCILRPFLKLLLPDLNSRILYPCQII